MRCPRVLGSGYHGCKTAVSADGELSDFFFVQVGVHGGFVLSPLLFATVMDALTEFYLEVTMHMILFCEVNQLMR